MSQMGCFRKGGGGGGGRHFFPSPCFPDLFPEKWGGGTLFGFQNRTTQWGRGTFFLNELFFVGEVFHHLQPPALSNKIITIPSIFLRPLTHDHSFLQSFTHIPPTVETYS